MRIVQIPLLPFLLLFVGGIRSNPIEKRDADFYSVRTFLIEDASPDHDPESPKYFHESRFSPHYDGRFANKPLPEEEQRKALSNMLQTYLATCKDIGVETWLMHGTLLGWWWNRKVSK